MFHKIVVTNSSKKFRGKQILIHEKLTVLLSELGFVGDQHGGFTHKAKTFNINM
jgi:hypothetical protein